MKMAKNQGNPINHSNPRSIFTTQNQTMKPLPLNPLSLLLLFFLFIATGQAQETIALSPNTQKLQEADWNSEEISEELTWKYRQFKDLFASVQSITILEIDTKDPDVSLVLPNVTSGFIKTSEAGAQAGAIAAINGSFFDTKVGGSTVFFKKDGEIINPTRVGFNEYRENAGFALDARNRPSIVARPEAGWESLAGFSSVLASGPLLIQDGQLVEQQQNPFNDNRHPRTAIGLTSDGRLLAVVVDGRSADAFGMSIPELAELMAALGCTSAMNLDGGGSSTAWIQGTGVVNHPSDNKKFDHKGERGVATVIAIKVAR